MNNELVAQYFNCGCKFENGSFVELCTKHKLSGALLGRKENRMTQPKVNWVTCEWCGLKMDKFYLKAHLKDSCNAKDNPYLDELAKAQELIREKYYGLDSRASGVTLEWLQEESYKVAEVHGWWDGERNFGEMLALIHSEVSEALEEWRTGAPVDNTYFDKNGKPEGVPSELADVLIRVADLAEHYGINLTKAVLAKMEYNRTRSWRHGGKIA